MLGLAGAARMLPYVLLSWAGGMLADRFRRDRLLRLTMVARVLLLAVVALAALSGWLLPAVLAASAAVACGTPAYPALAAAMPAVAGPDRRRATDLLVTIEVASFVVGPAVGGLLLAEPARPWLLGLSLGCTLAALALVTGVPLPRPALPAVPATASRTASPVAALRGSPAALRAVLLVAALNAVDAALALVLLPLAERVWTGGGAGYGPAVAVLGLGALAAPLLWWLGTSPAARARWGLLLLAGGLVVLTAGPAVGWGLLPLAVAGAASVHVEAAATETIQDGVADRHRASGAGPDRQRDGRRRDGGVAGDAVARLDARPPRRARLARRRLPGAGPGDRGGRCTTRSTAAGAVAARLRSGSPASGDRRRSRQAATTQSTRTPVDAARLVRTPSPATTPASADPREPAAVLIPAIDTNTMARSSGGL